MSAKKVIKKILIEEDLTMTELVEKYNNKFNAEDTIQNLSNKLSRGSLRYNEAEKIAAALGYKIEWIKK
ncbi:MAG: LLM class flavin-dependent oxidoreductase [Halanaerobiales bacterium]|jgi:CRISPR/Cas system-associated endonuclease Cas1|nr:LLM class flavin-dependent oxidoreductase [Halanaerobiales bacterium]